MPDVAELLPIASAGGLFPAGLTPKAIRRRIQSGQLKAVFDGSRWFTSREWVEEFLRATTAARVPPVESPASQRRAVDRALKQLEAKHGRKGQVSVR